MEKQFNNNFREEDVTSLKDYIRLIRINLFPIVLITFTGLLVALIYAINARDIYKSTTLIKISKPQGSILESPLIPEFQDFGNDRFIANEIEVLKSYTLRKQVAQAILDSFVISGDENKFALVFNEDVKGVDKKSTLYRIKRKLKQYITKAKNAIFQDSFPEKHSGPVKTIKELVELFEKKVSINQKRGLDIVEVSVESPSSYEASLLANLYANKYKELDLNYNRMVLVSVKNFLEKQRSDKLAELNIAEDALKSYQEKGGVIELSAQSKALIDQLTDFESKLNSVKVDLKISEKSLAQYKKELNDQNPKLTNYLESFASEPYLKSLQEQIAKLETNRELVTSSSGQGEQQKELLRQYDNKIKELKNKLNNKIEVYKSGIFASSPEEIKAITQKLLEEEVRYQALKASYNELKQVVSKYQKRFNEIPKRSIDLARLERNRMTLEKLYLLVEQKYQEAQINIESTPGNVLIIDPAIETDKPAKPNRLLIVLVGTVLGAGMGIGFAFFRNYIDDTVKTPDDITSKGIELLNWIPAIEGVDKRNREFELIVHKKPDAIPSEAFRALRTRLTYSSKGKNVYKTILITSSVPGEGKTTCAANLAASFAQAGKRTLIIDADLRKPRVHNVFAAKRQPGLVDYFFENAELKEIIKNSEVENLDFVTCGTIPPNPSEILGSVHMEEFLKLVSMEYDMVILDSAPVIAVTDSEILSRLVDATILVAAAHESEANLVAKSTELLKHNRGSFIGVVLNKFTYKNGYGNYYKYYYYYSNTKKNV